jgi:hypothetical protein
MEPLMKGLVTLDAGRARKFKKIPCQIVLGDIPMVTAQVARSQNPEVRMRMPATGSENLVVWQKTRQFVLAA